MSSSKHLTKSLLISLVVTSVVTASLVLHSTYVDIKKSEKTINKIDSIVVRSLEKAYFEGQKDYMNGDVRISRKINGKDTTYTILKSFWNNGDSMVFKP